MGYWRNFTNNSAKDRLQAVVERRTAKIFSELFKDLRRDEEMPMKEVYDLR